MQKKLAETQFTQPSHGHFITESTRHNAIIQGGSK